MLPNTYTNLGDIVEVDRFMHVSNQRSSWLNVNQPTPSNPGRMAGITTGASVLGVKFDKGVLVAADMLVCYGSMARYKDINRVLRINDRILMGGGGDYADVQAAKKSIDLRLLEDHCRNDGFKQHPKSLAHWFSRVFYGCRSKMAPLYIDAIIGGMDDHQRPYLCRVDRCGSVYEASVLATGFAKQIVLPLMRERRPLFGDFGMRDAAALIRDCMQVLYKRDTCCFSKYTVGICTANECRIRGPFQVDDDTDFPLCVQGLKKFLAQYPSIFLVDGDYVQVNAYQHTSSDDGNSGGKRDYIQEAKDYFKNKMLQYGAAAEVPVRSLLGHRSQASPQVRHISGQHIKEFTDFLMKHTDTFKVIDDYVLLVGSENMTDLPARDRLHLPQSNIDTRGTQQMLDFFAQCIEMKGPLLVDQLFHLLTLNFPQDQWLRMFKTPGDLSSFLKLFSDCFHIQANLVTLLQKPKLNDSHIQQAQARSREQFNALNNNQNPRKLESTTAVSSVQQRLQSPAMRGSNGYNSSSLNNGNGSSNNNNNINNMNNNIASPNFKLNAPVSNMTGGNGFGQGQNKSEPNSGFDSYVPMSELKLENLCENNFPSSTVSYGPIMPQQQQQAQQQPTQQQPTQQQPATPAERLNSVNQTLKQRINTLVIRTLAENLEKDKQSLANQSSHAQTSPVHAGNAKATATVATNTATATQNNTNQNPSHNYFVGDTWKIKVLQYTTVIANVKHSTFVTDALLDLAKDECKIAISLDCEGINLGIKGEITLIEIGTARGEAFLFDVQSCPAMVTDGGLKTLLEHEQVIKVIHDCRNDAVNLYLQFGILLRNVFDTQAAHAILQYQENGKQVYKAKYISLNSLCEHYDAPCNPIKDQLKQIYRRDQKFWAKRPLTREMMLYAAGDVLVLIHDQLFGTLAQKILPENRQLFSELCTEQILMQIKPNEVKIRKKQRKVSTEVSDLKQKLAQSSKSIVLSNREIRLLRYMDLTEDEKERLKGYYKVAKKLEKMESAGNPNKDQSDSDDDGEPNENEFFPSLDSVPSDNSLSGTFSPRFSSEPPSLTESMQMLEEILQNKSMDRLARIDKLEAILTTATTLPCDQIITSNAMQEQLGSSIATTENLQIIREKTRNMKNCNCHGERSITPILRAANDKRLVKLVDAESQTLSTGDVVITKIFFQDEHERVKDAVLSNSNTNSNTNSPKRVASN